MPARRGHRAASPGPRRGPSPCPGTPAGRKDGGRGERSRPLRLGAAKLLAAEEKKGAGPGRAGRGLPARCAAAGQPRARPASAPGLSRPGWRQAVGAAQPPLGRTDR